MGQITDGGKVTEQPWQKRFKKNRGDFTVPCRVSSRWLQFSTGGTAKLSEGEYITMWVMTEDSNDKAKKLCELIVTREDLQSALDLIERTPK